MEKESMLITRRSEYAMRIFRALQEICYEFDLENPIWLDNNIADFKRHSRTRFNQDSFIEHISFDYLEIQVIEED